jgi:large subunit ribosomal protein L9
MATEVILQDDVPNLGRIGDVVRVKPGYARNFLLPRGLAVEASRKNLRMLEHQKGVVAVKAEREHRSAEAAAKGLDGVRLVVKARAGDEGRLFGSVTNLDIERLLAERGLTIDRRKIQLEDPIKQLGVHTVQVQVGRKVRATIEVVVEAETEGGDS